MLALGASHAARGATPPAPEITGAGATFPARIYQQWADQYTQDGGVHIRYQPAGSSAGVKRMLAHEADFGATDVPMSQADLARHGLFQFPTVVGGIVPVVNLPALAGKTLRLTPDTLAAIFAGQLTQWNDPRIQALNPGVPLPGQRITRVVRADGSGTTEVFVQYLKQAAPAASAGIEARGNLAQWPGSTLAAEGTSKLIETLQATPNAIGYVSSDYVLRDKLQAVSLRNRSGDWMLPTVAALSAAIRTGGLFRQQLDAAPLIDLDGPGVWPIVTATYVLVPRSPASPERAGRVLNFFYRSFMLGDKSVAGTGFAPLPATTQARIVALLSDFRTASGQLVPVLLMK